MGATGMYLRRITGWFLEKDCCPASGIQTRSGEKSYQDKLSMLQPPSAKLTVDVTSADYTIPEEVANTVKGISVNTSGLVAITLANDGTSDTVYITQGIFFPCQPAIIHKTGTATTTGIRVYY